MDRPRPRRPDPQRTAPRRNAGEAWRNPEPPRDDGATRGVREGYRVIEEHIRRGRRAAEELDHEEPNGARRRTRTDRDDPERDRRREEPGMLGFLADLMRRTERLVREVLRQLQSGRPDPWRLAELIFRLHVESVSDLAAFGFASVGAWSPYREDRFARDVDHIVDDIEETFEHLAETDDESDDNDEDDKPWAEARTWPAGPHARTTIESTVALPVYVCSAVETHLQLDLSPDTPDRDLAVETLWPAPSDPPTASLSARTKTRSAAKKARVQPKESAPSSTSHISEVEILRLAGGPAILRLVVPRHLTQGRFHGRILRRSTGEPAGSLTVRLGADL